jgi:hypothetical protein
MVIQRFVDKIRARHNRVVAEVRQVQLEMARKGVGRPVPILPNRPNSATLIVIWLLILMGGTLLWVVITRA